MTGINDLLDVIDNLDLRDTADARQELADLHSDIKWLRNRNTELETLAEQMDIAIRGALNYYIDPEYQGAKMIDGDLRAAREAYKALKAKTAGHE